jgi:stearoyl-CoA desaturase (delta-9 desaturase)
MFSGVLDLPWWGYVVHTLVVTHITIAGVTIYLHRCQAHRGLELHPVVSHFFRFWLWLTTGMVTKVWAAIHRKHHAKVETVDDPHSPQIYGIKKVMWEGAELYRKEARNTETLERLGAGPMVDRAQALQPARSSHRSVLITSSVRFIGITIWAIQSVPFFAAIINGVGHLGLPRSSPRTPAPTSCRGPC